MADFGRSPSGRAGRPTDQAPAGLGDNATIPNAAMLFNINHWVAVQLTDFGRKVLRQNWDNWAGPLDIGPYHPRKTDENGWSRFQLWQLMEEFGPHISMGGELPFETIIRIEGSTAAIATEARRAETLKDGSVHEGAGLKGIAQTQSSTPDNKDKQDG